MPFRPFISAALCFSLLSFDLLAQYKGGFAGGPDFEFKVQNACGTLIFGANYQGGSGDAYSRDTLTQQLCPALFINVNYFGSGGDGYTSGNLNPSFCAPQNLGFNYFGGNSDAYARDTLTQQLCPALFINVNYFGGAKDGYAFGDLPQSTCPPLFFGFNFRGGFGDGFARDTLTQQLCPALFINVNYFGGTSDGFSINRLLQAPCPNLAFNNNYFGGNGDGFFASVLQQSNCPALLYYYRSVANGNWNTLATWEFSTDPLYINPPPAVATTPPTFNNSYEILVRNTHAVSINSAVTADDLKINSGGTLSVLGGNFVLNNGSAATDLTIDGTLNISSTTNLPAGAAIINNGLWSTSVNTLSSAASITHNSTGIYRHGFDGGTIPVATWNSGSTLQITGIVNATGIGGMNQSFHHVEYNSSGQVTPFVDLNGSITAINGNLTLVSTGNNTRELRLFNTGINTNSSLVVGGNVLLNTGSRLAITNSASSGAANPSLTINGNLTLNGNAVLDMTGNGAGTATGSNIVLLGDLSLNGTSTLIRTQNTPSVFRFNKASGIQNFNAAAPTTALASGNITYFAGNGTNSPELVLGSDFVMNGSASLTINSNAILNAGTSIVRGSTAGGNGSFTLSNNATLKTGNTNGISGPLTSTSGSVQTGTIKNFSNAATYIYNGFSNQITGTGLPLTIVSPGQLTIANLGPVVNNTVTLTTTGTTTPLLNMQSGKFAIGTGQTLNITNNGSVAVSGTADFTVGSTAGTVNAPGAATFSGNSNPFNVYTSGGIDFGTGTVTIQTGGAFRINSGGFVNTNGPFYSNGSTLEYNTGGNFERGFEWNASSGRGYPHHVSVLTTNLNPARANSSFAATPFQTGGNLNINSGSSIQMDFGGSNMTAPLIINGDLTLSGNLSASQAAGGDIEIKGNWLNNGSGINFSPNNRTVSFNGSLAENLGGSNTTINPFSSFVLNNAAGLTLTGADVQVDNQVNLQSGNVNLNSRTFTLGKPGTNGTLIGGGALAYFNSGNVSSRFVRYTTTAGSTYAFPVGTGLTYSPTSVDLYGNTSTTSNSRISVHVIPSPHPNLGTSTNYLNRYWGVEPFGFGATTHYGINYVYNDADVVGLEPNLKPFKYNTAGWIAALGSGADFEMGTGTVNPGTNTIDWQGLYSFSDFTANGNGTPLPISLLEFNAKPLLNQVELTWITATEINNDYFTVERSKDGLSFTAIATVDGAGNSNTVLNYKTMDERPLDGVSYYRLKQTDYDGRYEYSDIRVVNFRKPGSEQEWLVYPNPSDLMGVNISAANLNHESVELRLTDIAGKLVFKKTAPVNANQIQGFISFGDIATGVYNLSLFDGSEVKNFRIILTGK